MSKTRRTIGTVEKRINEYTYVALQPPDNPFNKKGEFVTLNLDSDSVLSRVVDFNDEKIVLELVS